MEKAHSGKIKQMLKSLHAEIGGDHLHIHGHEDGFTTHHVSDGSAVQGPVEHKTMGAVKKHVAAVMDADEDGE